MDDIIVKKKWRLLEALTCHQRCSFSYRSLEPLPPASVTHKRQVRHNDTANSILNNNTKPPTDQKQTKGSKVKKTAPNGAQLQVNHTGSPEEPKPITSAATVLQTTGNYQLSPPKGPNDALFDSIQREPNKVTKTFNAQGEKGRQIIKLIADNEKLKLELSQTKSALEHQLAETEKCKGDLIFRDAQLETIQKENEKLQAELAKYQNKKIADKWSATEGLTEQPPKAPIDAEEKKIVHLTGMKEAMKRVLDYETGKMYPNAMFNLVSDSLFSYGEVCTRLHQEILVFTDTVTQYNAQNKDLFDCLLSEMRRDILEVIPGVEFFEYGSFATDLSLPWSDIDIAILIPQTCESNNPLLLIDKYFNSRKWVAESKCIQNASIPILKVTASKEYLHKKMDITILDSRHNGITCKEAIRKFVAYYEPVRPLALIVKQMLYSINFKDPYFVSQHYRS